MLAGFILSAKPIKAILAKSYDIQSEELLALRAKTLELEELASQQNLMIFKLQRLISGETIVDTTTASSLLLASADTIRPVLPIAEDEQLFCLSVF